LQTLHSEIREEISIYNKEAKLEIPQVNNQMKRMNEIDTITDLQHEGDARIDERQQRYAY